MFKVNNKKNRMMPMGTGYSNWEYMFKVNWKTFNAIIDPSPHEEAIRINSFCSMPSLALIV